MVAIGLGLAFAGACGGREKPSETPLGGGASGAPAPAFKDMTVNQQKELMKKVVVPKMTTVFQEYDAKRFKDVDCKTCHGPGAKEGKFKMPNPTLPKLDPKDEFAKHKQKDPKIVAFMMEKVVPTMADALKLSPYNPETHKGFGCGNCHVMVGAPAADAATKPEAPPAKPAPAK